MDSILDAKSENTIKHDQFDAGAYTDMSENAEKLQEAVDQSKPKLATVERLAQDMFYSLYKYLVQPLPDDEIADTHQFNKTLMQKAIETQEYDRLRCVTKLQPLESAIATISFIERLLQELPQDELNKVNQAMQEVQDTQKRIDKMMNQISGLQSAADAAKGTPQAKQLQQQAQNLQKQLQQDQNKNQQTTQAMKQNISNMSQEIRRAVRAAENHAEGEVKNFTEFVTGWGLESGQFQKLAYKDKIELAKKLMNSNRLKQLSQLVGRFKRLALAKRQERIRKEPSEIVDVTQSDDLSRVLPSEMLLLAQPETEILFAQKLITKQLLTWEMDSKDKMARGPIIVCIDNSGSMSGVREIWSKAVAIALLELATKDKRKLAVIHFGSASDPLKVIEVDPQDEPVVRLKKVIEIAEYFLNGGTDFVTPLTKATEIIKLQNYKQADIVFVTDGEADVPDEFKAEFAKTKKQLQFKVISVCIGGGDESLRKFSEAVFQMEDLVKQGQDVASRVFELI